MPLYEYECKKCGHRFERIQSFSAEPVKECPVCQGEVERLISAPALQFKGSGFYSTDYAAKPSSNGGQASGETAGKPSTGDGKAAETAPTKSETKSDAKSDAQSNAKSNAKTDTSSTPAPAPKNN